MQSRSTSGQIKPETNTGTDRSLDATHLPVLFASDTDAGSATLRLVSEEPNLHDDVRSAWDELAAFWDERMEVGATWQRHLIQPSVERLLRLERGERVL